MTAKSSQILVVNPNSTVNMTQGLVSLISQLPSISTPEYFTAPPTSPPSINNSSDALLSCDVCLPILSSLHSSAPYAAYLIACYSDHPLVSALGAFVAPTPVVGIFESSVSAALLMIRPEEKFGIVSTGKVWEGLLSDAVEKYLGGKGEGRFAGVETTGLNATDLHDAPQEEVRQRMVEATKRLVGKGDVGAVLLGCAGMAGMEEMVRSACVEELGEEKGARVRIVDGVKVGLGMLDGLVKAGLV